MTTANLNLTFNKYPEQVPPNDSWFFFIHHQTFYGQVVSGYAKIEYTWDNEEGGQVIYTGEETEEEIKELTAEGYKLIHAFVPEEGDSTPHGHFLWCPAEALGDMYEKEYPEEFES